MKREEFIRKWAKDHLGKKYRTEMLDDLDALIVSEKMYLLENLNKITQNHKK